MIEDYKNKVSYLEILVYRLNNLISYFLENSDDAKNLYEDYKAKKNDKDIKKELERLREKDKEIERLNNIINGLEKFMKMQQELYTSFLSKSPEDDIERNTQHIIMIGNEQLSIILDKLQELKKGN